MQNNGTPLPRVAHGLVLAASLFIIIFGIKAAAVVIVPFLLAAFISVICSPAVLLLKRIGIPYGLSVLLVIMAILFAGSFIGGFIGGSMAQFRDNLPGYYQAIEQKTAALLVWLNAHNVHISQSVILEHFDPRTALKLVASMLSGFGGVLTQVFLILIAVAFMLFEGTNLQKKLHDAFNSDDVYHNLDTMMTGVNRYLLLKTLISIFTGVLVFLLLLMFKIDNPALWGLLAFMLNYVPNIGSIIAAVPAVFLALIQHGLV